MPEVASSSFGVVPQDTFDEQATMSTPPQDETVYARNLYTGLAIAALGAAIGVAASVWIAVLFFGGQIPHAPAPIPIGAVGAQVLGLLGVSVFAAGGVTMGVAQAHLNRIASSSPRRRWRNQGKQ